jgi:hypothetical protein
VSTCRRSRFIDRDGKVRIVVYPDDADVSPFSDGLAALGVLDDTNMRLGYIDKHGKLVRPLSN